LVVVVGAKIPNLIVVVGPIVLGICSGEYDSYDIVASIIEELEYLPASLGRKNIGDRIAYIDYVRSTCKIQTHSKIGFSYWISWGDEWHIFFSFWPEDDRKTPPVMLLNMMIRIWVKL
jgi:hypothetical protein